MKQVLIYGKNSYIGSNIKKWLQSCGYSVRDVDAITVPPSQIDFRDVDVVINVAGIAHVKIKKEMESLFYRVNRDLAVELAAIAKQEHVSQYIYFSSMNVYGDTTEAIECENQENPKNFYGGSKAAAEKALFSLEDENFKVLSIRPPVVYGWGCKGNFPLLVKIAKIAFVFPKFYNKKSMIYIDHLCEFVRIMIERKARGKKHPQNAELTSTVDIICAIRSAWGKKTILFPGFSWAIRLAMKFVNKVQRAFANDYYSLSFSEYAGGGYSIIPFEETIRRTVLPCQQKWNYAILTTVSSTMENFGIPLAEQLVNEGHRVHVVCKMTNDFQAKYKDAYSLFDLDIARGFHFLNSLKTIVRLKKFFRQERFDVVQYGTENAAFCASVAAWLAGVPVRIYEHWGARYVGFSGFKRFISKMIERIAALFSTHVRQVSFRNMEMCVHDHIYPQKKVSVLGKGGTVGVDFSKFDLQKKPEYNAWIRAQYNIREDAFVYGFVGRIQQDKGINELLDAFAAICDTDSNVYLMLVGNEDSENPISAEKMQWAKDNPHVIFTGHVADVYRYMSAFDILVHPTYREGFGMVLQEAAALKIPIITTDIIGPGEYILHDETGALVPVKNVESLLMTMEALKLNAEKRIQYAENNYIYTLQHFERSVMVARILEDRKTLLKSKGLL